MAEDREGFLGRWSRLKQARRTGDSESPETPDADSAENRPAAAAADAAQAGETGQKEGDEALDLPPIDSLDKDSDFTVFMKEGVPDEIRHQALRKLWLTDPVLANLDGLLEYGEDFSEPWRVTGVVKTLYQVGKGMPGPVAEVAEEIAGDAAAEPSDAPPSEAQPSEEPPSEEEPSTRPSDEPADPDEVADAAAKTRPENPTRPPSAPSDSSKPTEEA